MKTAIVIGVALALGGCAHHRVVRGGETITYATAPCFGTCPVYVVTLGPDGQGIFVGEQHTAATGEHRFQATPDQVRAFTERLAAYRPKREDVIKPGTRKCKQAATDQSSVDIRWQSAVGRAAHLNLYYGCDGSSHRAMFDALRSAPDLLPIVDLIGKH